MNDDEQEIVMYIAPDEVAPKCASESDAMVWPGGSMFAEQVPGQLLAAANHISDWREKR